MIKVNDYLYRIFFVYFDVYKTTLDQKKQSKFLETNSKFVDLDSGAWSDEQVITMGSKQVSKGHPISDF